MGRKQLFRQLKFTFYKLNLPLAFSEHKHQPLITALAKAGGKICENSVSFCIYSSERASVRAALPLMTMCELPAGDS